jgi:hypothetical protein
VNERAGLEALRDREGSSPAGSASSAATWLSLVKLGARVTLLDARIIDPLGEREGPGGVRPALRKVGVQRIIRNTVSDG